MKVLNSAEDRRLKGAYDRMRRGLTVTQKDMREAGSVMEEKRKHKRRYLVAEVQVRRTDEGDSLYAMAVNISEEGIGLYTQNRLGEGDHVLVKITVLIKGTVIVSEEVPGAVRWVEPIDKNYATGIKFDSAIVKDRFPVLYKCLEYSKLSSQQDEE